MDSSPVFEPSNQFRPYAVAPDLDAAFDIPLRASQPISSKLPSMPSTSRLPATPADGPMSGESTSLLRGVTAAGMIGFASTALVMPIDVAKILLQVQWIPREEVSLAELEPEEREDEDELSDEAEAEAYFDDVTSRSRSSVPMDGASLQQGPRGRRQRDRAGYIQRSSVFDESTAPEHVLPIVITGGIWEMIKALYRSKTEGFFALWKGQVTTFIAETLESGVRPFCSLLLTSAFAPMLSGVLVAESPRPALSLLLEVTARVVTGLVLSPLDLIRTRLIVQSSAPRFRKYRGPLHALRCLLEEEGGLGKTFFHANLLFPTLLDCTLRSIFTLSTPLVIERLFKLRADVRPLAYGIAAFGLGTASLLVTLPIETVRRRLQLQSRATAVTRARPYRACVETRPVPYAGAVDCLYRIVVEETTSVPPQIAARRGRSAVMGEPKANGLGQLYHGLSVGIAANLLVFVLGLLGERDAL